MTGLADITDEYRDRAREAAGVTPAAGAAVPLLLGDTTWGNLGFLHFNLHAWVPAEINALQAVASMLVQLQARIDAEERTRYNANHDELTGLPNRRALVHELKTRLDANRKTAVMVIDLDRFKVMNDYLGHGMGDRLLVTIADRIRTSIRANDFAARLGGDEFVFIVDKVKSEMEVLATAYRILDIIAQPVDISGQEVSHTASIGIAISETDAVSGLDLLGWADVAMYSAKARGRNQAVVFDREAARSRQRALAHRVDAARSHRRRRTSPSLPARGRHPRRPPPGGRGSRALGSPPARDPGGDGVHPGRRGDRDGHRHRTLGVRRGLPPARRVAGRIPQARLRGPGQHVPGRLQDGGPRRLRQAVPPGQRRPRQTVSASRSPSTP